MEPFLGQIQLLPYNFAPNGWAFCEGQLMAISQNTALFSLLGTTYGGDGTTNFALPNLKGKEPDPNTHFCIALVGIYPSRS
ncbi:phage Tail Collar domain protein [Polaromonas naphthalenivorans CJ2]|uniref:Phage Tail Collar domain protein n=1 Tax=Polaromonas naphthalenivorans (strain CJ2) TaxID=365044 RepID=A1VJT6_POLNA|nr:tail fiber protein [Polaromonas naphthalenivorans]ABM35914.1 phage Tail Collar domain protein [Polaromonas naphthalenivorans CJ2]